MGVANDPSIPLRQALRDAPPLALDLSLVRSHIDSQVARASVAEAGFAAALDGGLRSIDRPPGLAGVIGHVAESVAETMLVDAG